MSRERKRRLSDYLREKKFLLVHRSTERVSQRDTLVRTGKPYTWDTNNGVSVIYDEQGHPWIKQGPVEQIMLVSIFSTFHVFMTRGAYVPHSNDGGRFIRQHTPVKEGERAQVLMGVIESIIGRYQTVHRGNLDNSIFKLFETAKNICRAENEDALHGAKQELGGH